MKHERVELWCLEGRVNARVSQLRYGEENLRCMKDKLSLGEGTKRKRKEREGKKLTQRGLGGRHIIGREVKRKEEKRIQ